MSDEKKDSETRREPKSCGEWKSIGEIAKKIAREVKQ